jgi:chromosome segregation ATPase
MRGSANAVAVFEDEADVEQQVARLESDVAHIRTDMADVKKDLRDLRHEVGTLRDKLDVTNEAVFNVKSKLETDIADLRTDLKADLSALTLTLERFIGETRAKAEKTDATVRVALALNKVWLLATAAGLLGILARALKWI